MIMWVSEFGLWSRTGNHKREQWCFCLCFTVIWTFCCVISQRNATMQTSAVTILKEKPFRPDTQVTHTHTHTHTHVHTHRLTFFPIITQSCTEHTNPHRLIHPAVPSFLPVVQWRWPHLIMSQRRRTANSPVSLENCPHSVRLHDGRKVHLLC